LVLFIFENGERQMCINLVVAVCYSASAQAFREPIIAFTLILSYLAAPFGVLAIITSVMKYQADMVFDNEKQESYKQMVTTLIGAVVLIMMPLIINLFFWVLTGDIIGWGFDELMLVCMI